MLEYTKSGYCIYNRSNFKYQRERKSMEYVKRNIFSRITAQGFLRSVLFVLMAIQTYMMASAGAFNELAYVFEKSAIHLISIVAFCFVVACSCYFLKLKYNSTYTFPWAHTALMLPFFAPLFSNNKTLEMVWLLSTMPLSVLTIALVLGRWVARQEPSPKNDYDAELQRFFFALPIGLLLTSLIFLLMFEVGRFTEGGIFILTIMILIVCHPILRRLEIASHKLHYSLDAWVVAIFGCGVMVMMWLQIFSPVIPSVARESILSAPLYYLSTNSFGILENNSLANAPSYLTLLYTLAMSLSPDELFNKIAFAKCVPIILWGTTACFLWGAIRPSTSRFIAWSSVALLMLSPWAVAAITLLDNSLYAGMFLLAMVQYIPTPNSSQKWWYVSGVCGGVSILCMPSMGVLVISFLLLTRFYRGLAESEKRKQTLFCMLAIICAVFIPALPYILRNAESGIALWYPFGNFFNTTSDPVSITLTNIAQFNFSKTGNSLLSWQQFWMPIPILVLSIIGAIKTYRYAQTRYIIALVVLGAICINGFSMALIVPMSVLSAYALHYLITEKNILSRITLVVIIVFSALSSVTLINMQTQGLCATEAIFKDVVINELQTKNNLHATRAYLWNNFLREDGESTAIKKLKGTNIKGKTICLGFIDSMSLNENFIVRGIYNSDALSMYIRESESAANLAQTLIRENITHLFLHYQGMSRISSTLNIPGKTMAYPMLETPEQFELFKEFKRTYCTEVWRLSRSKKALPEYQLFSISTKPPLKTNPKTNTQSQEQGQWQ